MAQAPRVPVTGTVRLGTENGARVAVFLDPEPAAPSEGDRRPPHAGAAASAAGASTTSASSASRADSPAGSGSALVPPPTSVATSISVDAAAPRPTAAARLDAIWLSFVPKVQVVAPGTPLVLADADDESHTVHAWFDRATLFDLATTPHGREQRVRLDRRGVVAITCDLHREMRAYVLVSAARYSAVTDTAGRFRFGAVPPGRYRVRVFRPGEDELAVDAEPGVVVATADVRAPTTLAVALPAATRRSADPPLGDEAPAPSARLVREGASSRRASTGIPPWLARLADVTPWPTGRVVYPVAALALVLGLLIAVGNLRLAARRGGSRPGAVLVGCGLSFISALSLLVGLHPGVASALGFGIFIGTAVFGAGEVEPPR